MESFFKSKEPFDPFLKFNIFSSYNAEKIAGYLKGSPVNHTEWTADTLKSNQFIEQLEKISIPRDANLPPDYYLKNYDEMLWSVDQLKNAMPNVNWDKILTGLLGRANVIDKIFIGDVNFTKRFNDVIKNADKRLFYNF